MGMSKYIINKCLLWGMLGLGLSVIKIAINVKGTKPVEVIGGHVLASVAAGLFIGVFTWMAREKRFKGFAPSQSLNSVNVPKSKPDGWYGKLEESSDKSIKTKIIIAFIVMVIWLAVIYAFFF